MTTYEYAIILAGLVAFVSLIILILALIGLKERKKEREYLKKYNEDSIKSFMKGVKNKKYARKSTPRVPTIKK